MYNAYNLSKACRKHVNVIMSKNMKQGFDMSLNLTMTS